MSRQIYPYNKIDGTKAYIDLEDISSVESVKNGTSIVSMKNGKVFELIEAAEFIKERIAHVFAIRL